MVLPASRFQAFAAIAALVAGGSSSSMSASALELTVADCSDFAALTTDAMTEDVNLFLDDAIVFTCDEVSIVCLEPHALFLIPSLSLAIGYDLGCRRLRFFSRYEALNTTVCTRIYSSSVVVLSVSHVSHDENGWNDAI